MTALVYHFEALRGVGHVRLTLAPNQQVYTLFGSNGIGKTKCLEALFQYHLLQNTEFVEWAKSPLIWPSLYDSIVSRTMNGPQGIVLGHSVNKIEFPTWLSANRPGSVSRPCVFLGAGARGHIQGGPGNLSGMLPIGTFEQRRKSYFTALEDGMRNRFYSLGMGSDLEQWFVTRAQSANPYQKKADNRRTEIDTLLQLLNRIDDRYDASFLEVDGANHVSLRVDDELRDLRNLSTGFTSLVKLLQAIVDGYGSFTNAVELTQVRGFIFIDEIESHLHTQWQSKVIRLLKELFPNTTFFVATHSPIVLSQLWEGEAYLLERKDGEVRSEPIQAPDKRILSDVLAEAMSLDLNALKVQHMDPKRQEGAKATLLQLIDADGAAPDA